MPPTPLPSSTSAPQLALGDAVLAALRRIEGSNVKLVAITPIAEDRAATELKHIGYGEPLLVRYRVGAEERRLVLRTMTPNWFGHDRRADRAALALLAADTYAALPRHVQPIDVGAIDEHGALVSLRGTGEFYLMTTYAEGQLYAQDLRRIERTCAATELDLARVHALSGYLVDLHTSPFHGPHQLYHRAIRDLVGSGEGIFGIADSYPTDGHVGAERLAAIEQRCVAWRWRLRRRARRLRRTHGDFHPYNILFRSECDFTLLDASRGSVGEPADDLAAMAVNFVFGGVVHPASWQSGMKPLWDAFWSSYLSSTGDYELLEVVAPFLAWRALVVASPVWYPSLTNEQRDTLLSFAEATLDASALDPADASRFAG